MMLDYDDIKYLSCFLEDYFLSQGMNVTAASYLNLFINIGILTILILLIKYIVHKFIVRLFIAITNKSKTTFDDFLIKTNFPKYIGQIPPILLIYYSLPFVLIDHQFILKVILFLLNLYVIVLAIWIFRSLLRTTKNYLQTREEYRDKPVESYIQVLMIVVWTIGIMVMFAEITGESVLNFIISFGAASAILLLIFKDTILGFVASIQISVNDIVRIGDWITFSKFGADGFVTEINLATVKVQNWDKTYTTIPTYSLIADSFHNWRGMQESPGRRIKRAINIKQNSVKFVTPADLERYQGISLIAPYLKQRQEEIDLYNHTNKIEKDVILNGRNQTNLGIYRKYVDSYLKQHSFVNKDLFVMARYLDPTPTGLPLEIYCFSKDKNWVNYEHISADIFDHLIAALPYFDLKIFELPSGDDVREYGSVLPYTIQ